MLHIFFPSRFELLYQTQHNWQQNDPVCYPKHNDSEEQFKKHLKYISLSEAHHHHC